MCTIEGVSETPNFHARMRSLLRERIIETARDVVSTEGWGAVNMSRLAKDVGVSRPVLYKEVGTKQELADLVIRSEVETFLVGIDDSLAAHPDDPVAGVIAAAGYALRAAADNTLIKAVLAGRSEADTALLPTLMTDPEPVLGRALAALTTAVRTRYGLTELSDEDLSARVESVVRLTLSHLFQPLGSVERALEQISVVVVSVLGPVTV
ncbi:TetR family transcriptional regulator [Nocardia puris]|uniref:TetR family transcriptional regulator n=1 Tax=Nocardia puris TaxID=208602 RepID=A0A366D2Q2_9NOCA|nr:TetR family transcriptional regulator [Nocardia puris]